MAASKIKLETLQKLAKYDTPTICNVIELFDIRPRNVGYMDARIRAAFPEMPPMVGFAATASMRCAAPAKRSSYDMLETQLKQFQELAGPAVVVFQDLDDPPIAATFGEVMCSTYRAFGSVGIVTSGGGRDLEQVRALNYPVLSARPQFVLMDTRKSWTSARLFMLADFLSKPGSCFTAIAMALLTFRLISRRKLRTRPMNLSRPSRTFLSTSKARRR